MPINPAEHPDDRPDPHDRVTVELAIAIDPMSDIREGSPLHQYYLTLQDLELAAKQDFTLARMDASHGRKAETQARFVVACGTVKLFEEFHRMFRRVRLSQADLGVSAEQTKADYLAQHQALEPWQTTLVDQFKNLHAAPEWNINPAASSPAEG